MKRPADGQRARQIGESSMEGSEHDVARRTVLMSAGLVGANLVGANLVGAGLVAGTSQARRRKAAAAGEAEIWSQEYWAHKGNMKLNLWRKRVGAPKPGEQRGRSCFWCTARRTPRARPTTSSCRRQGRILADERHGARKATTSGPWTTTATATPAAPATTPTS